MDSKCYFDCKFYFVGYVCLAVLTASCSTPEKTAQIPVDDLPKILREVQKPADTTSKNAKDIKLTYQNKSTNVTIPVDPQNQSFILEMKGLQKEKSQDSVNMQDSLIQARMAKKIKQVMRDFRRAQDLFYREDYKGALEKVNSSLETQKTADALGLKGTIFFMRDNMSSAKYYWNKAVQMDPEIPVPDIPELESFIKKIKASEQQGEAE